jgi:hypothetical protein
MLMLLWILLHRQIETSAGAKTFILCGFARNSQGQGAWGKNRLMLFAF